MYSKVEPLELHLQAMEPCSSINVPSGEGAHALSKQDISPPQVLGEVEKLHRTAQSTSHLQICDHASTRSSFLCLLALPFHAATQDVHLVHTLLSLQFASRLSFSNVSTKVAVRCRLGSLSLPNNLPQRASLEALTFARRSFVGLLDHWQEVVGANIGVAASECDTEARRCAVHPFIVAKPHHPVYHVPGAAGWQLAITGDALTDQ